MSLFVGVDVGGTTSTICLGDQDGRLEYLSPQFPTRSKEGPHETIEDLADSIVGALDRMGRSLSDVSMVTLATPGPATIDGVLLSTPNLSGEQWNQCPIRELLQSRLQQSVAGSSVAVKYLGDGQAAALGEFALRRGKVCAKGIDSAGIMEMGIKDVGSTSLTAELESLFMVAVGTGLGGGEVRDGRVVRGRKGRAGHAGHLMLPPNAFRYEHDRALKVGNSLNTAESAVSLTALTHQLAYRLGLDRWKEHSLHQVPGTDKDRAKCLRELAADRDPLAIELIQDQAKALGLALLSIQYIGDYDLLVIGGGVCDMTESIREEYLTIIKSTFHDHALDGFRDFDQIVFSSCGDQASVIGAYVDAMGDEGPTNESLR